MFHVIYFRVMYHSVFARLFPTVCFLFYLVIPSLVAKLSKVSHTEGKDVFRCSAMLFLYL